jgi:hypothetical protein
MSPTFVCPNRDCRTPLPGPTVGFCPQCGTRLDPAGPASFAQRFARRLSARSPYAFACLIVGVFSLLAPIIVVDGVAAIILGVLARRDIRRRKLAGQHLVLIGMCCGLFSLAWAAWLYVHTWQAAAS